MCAVPAVTLVFHASTTTSHLWLIIIVILLGSTNCTANEEDLLINLVSLFDDDMLTNEDFFHHQWENFSKISLRKTTEAGRWNERIPFNFDDEKKNGTDGDDNRTSKWQVKSLKWNYFFFERQDEWNLHFESKDKTMKKMRSINKENK